jgi:DNA-binding response OmpR family regulator
VVARYPHEVPELLIATDSPKVFEEVRAAVEEPGVGLRWAREGRYVVPNLEERSADLVIADLQIGSMGGYAIAMDMALETGAKRMSQTPALLLLDRRPDVFLARRTGVQGWLMKPLDPIRLRRAVAALLAGGTYYDETFLPQPANVLAAEASAG